MMYQIPVAAGNVHVALARGRGAGRTKICAVRVIDEVAAR